MILFIAQPLYIYELKRTLLREHFKINNGITKTPGVNLFQSLRFFKELITER